MYGFHIFIFLLSLKDKVFRFELEIVNEPRGIIAKIVLHVFSIHSFMMLRFRIKFIVVLGDLMRLGHIKETFIGYVIVVALKITI